MKNIRCFQKFFVVIALILSCAAANLSVAEDVQLDGAILQKKTCLLAHNYTTQNGPQIFSCYHQTKCVNKEVEYTVGFDEKGRPIIERRTVSECGPDPSHTCSAIN